jgi:hypothetical protein
MQRLRPTRPATVCDSDVALQRLNRRRHFRFIIFHSMRRCGATSLPRASRCAVRMRLAGRRRCTATSPGRNGTARTRCARPARHTPRFRRCGATSKRVGVISISLFSFHETLRCNVSTRGRHGYPYGRGSSSPWSMMASSMISLPSPSKSKKPDTVPSCLGGS